MVALILVLAFAAASLEIRVIRNLHREGLRNVQVTPPAPRASSLDALVAAAAKEITELCELRACWFELFPFETLLPRIEPGRILLPPEEPGLPPLSHAGVELPVVSSGLPLGRFVLVPTAPTVAVMFQPTARDEAIAISDRFAAPLAAALIRGENLDPLATPTYANPAPRIVTAINVPPRRSA